MRDVRSQLASFARDSAPFAALALSLVAACASPSADAAGEVDFGTGVEFEVSSERERSLVYRADFDGVLHAGVESPRFAPILRVEAMPAQGASPVQEERELLALDDGADGRREAHVALLVRSGERLRIAVGARHPRVEGRVTLRLVPAPETDATRLAARRAREAHETARAELERAEPGGGATDRALLTVVEALDAALRVPGGEQSDQLTDAVAHLGLLAARLGAGDSAARAWRRVNEVRERELPARHPRLQRAQNALAAVSRTGEAVPRVETEDSRLEIAFSRPLPESTESSVGAAPDLARALFYLD